MNNADVSLELYKCFELILERYYLPRDFSGSYRNSDFDFYKFIGHELFVIFFSFLIRESNWELIADLLEEDIYVENNEIYGKPSLVSFTYVSQDLDLLNRRNNRLKLNRKSLHADILHERHTNGELAKLVPMQQFMDADCFLFLRVECQKEESSNWINWWGAWSRLYMDKAPRYLLEASRAKYAQRLLRPLGVNNIDILRVRLSHAAEQLQKMYRSPFPVYHNRFGNFDPLSIGSR